MKKSAIALAAIAAVSGTAFAQSTVELYGIVDLGIKYENGASAAGKVWTVSSGQQSGSRVGLRGKESLGNNLSASFVLENGFNADDGTLGYGGRLFGRQAWVGLNGSFGSVKLGRQPSAIYNALLVIDPFQINQAGNIQRVYGYGLGKVDPISRADNSITYTTPVFNGVTATAGYAFGETPGSINTNSSKFAGLAYVAGPLNIQAAYQNTDGVALGAATTQLGSLVAPTGLGSPTANVKNAFIGAIYEIGSVKAHVGFGDTKASATGDAKIRNYLVGFTAALGTGSAYGSWNRNDVRSLSAGTSDQVGLGYSYPLSKRTNLYTSASYTKNDSGVRMNAAVSGTNAREFQAGIRHFF